MGKITQNQTGSNTHSTIRSKEPVDIDIDTIDGFRVEASSKSWGANALRLAKAAGKAKPVSCTTAVKRSKTTGETATKKALDTLVKKEKENSEGDNPLCDERVIEFTNLDWENAPNNISLRALSTLLSVCSYQRDSLKANILRKIMSLDLKSMESDIVEENLLPEIETIALMADTTLPQTWEIMISLNAKIGRLFPELMK